MNMFRYVMLTAVLCVAFPVSSRGDARGEVLQLEQKRYDTLIAGDMQGFGDLMAEEFFYNHSLGGTITKADYLANMDANVKVKKAVLDEPQVRLYDDIVLVTGTSHISITLKGEEMTNHYRYLHIWQKKPAGWKLIARQATFLPKDK